MGFNFYYSHFSLLSLSIYNLLHCVMCNSSLPGSSISSYFQKHLWFKSKFAVRRCSFSYEYSVTVIFCAVQTQQLLKVKDSSLALRQPKGIKHECVHFKKSFKKRIKGSLVVLQTVIRFHYKESSKFCCLKVLDLEKHPKLQLSVI